MSVRKFTMIVSLVLSTALIAAGCGGDDASGAPTGDATTAMATDPGDETEAADDGNEPAEVTEKGTITIEGTEYAVTTLNRCEIDGGGEGDVDLQALAQGVKLNLYFVGANQDVSVDGSKLDELYGSNAFGRDVVIHASAIEGDRMTGSATVADSRGSGTMLDIAWDVQLTDEIRDCSL